MTTENFVSFVVLSFIIGFHAVSMAGASPRKGERLLIVTIAVVSILIMMYAFMKV